MLSNINFSSFPHWLWHWKKTQVIKASCLTNTHSFPWPSSQMLDFFSLPWTQLSSPTCDHVIKFWTMRCKWKCGRNFQKGSLKVASIFKDVWRHHTNPGELTEISLSLNLNFYVYEVIAVWVFSSTYNQTWFRYFLGYF